MFLRLTVTDQFGGRDDDQLQAEPAREHRADGQATGARVRHAGTAAVALTGTATDPQTTATPAQSLTHQWTQVDGAGVLLPVEDPLHVTINNDTTLTPTFDAPATPGAVHFQLTVSDGAATVSATHTMDITLGTNTAPTADAGPDQTGSSPARR